MNDEVLDFRPPTLISQNYDGTAINQSAMKFLLISLTTLVSSSVVSGEAWATSIVECSKSNVATSLSLRVCATTSFSTPDPVMTDTGKEIFLGGYHSDYKIVTGLKEGTDTATLSQSELINAYKNGISVQVELDDDEVCKVTIHNKNKKTECKSCSYCGWQKYTADCTNIPHGRKTKCESAAGSQMEGLSKVFFPLTSSALSSPKPPTSATVKNPVASPVKDAK
jgi:hypothetical protein